MMKETMRIKTSNLLIREMQMFDHRAFYKLVSNPELTVPAGELPIKGVANSMMLLHKMICEKCLYAIVESKTNIIIGLICITKDILGNEYLNNLGIIIDNNFGVESYTTEVIQAMVEWGGDKQGGHYFSLTHSKVDKFMSNIMKKLGYSVYYESLMLERDAFPELSEEDYYRLV